MNTLYNKTKLEKSSNFSACQEVSKNGGKSYQLFWKVRFTTKKKNLRQFVSLYVVGKINEGILKRNYNFLLINTLEKITVVLGMKEYVWIRYLPWKCWQKNTQKTRDLNMLSWLGKGKISGFKERNCGKHC